MSQAEKTVTIYGDEIVDAGEKLKCQFVRQVDRFNPEHEYYLA